MTLSKSKHIVFFIFVLTIYCNILFKKHYIFLLYNFLLYRSTIERYKCSIIEQMKNEQDQFEVLRKIQKTPESSQRELAEELGFSLGKLNYCLKALQKKGLVKLQNFQRKDNKISYLQYVITPKGISERTKLTINFMKRKMKEYDELKKELEKK